MNINLEEILYDWYASYVSQKDIATALTYTLLSLCSFCKLRDWKPHIAPAPRSCIFCLKVFEYLVMKTPITGPLTQDRMFEFRFQYRCELWLNKFIY